MCQITEFFGPYAFLGDELPLQKALNNKKVTKIIMSPNNELVPGRYGSVIVEHRNASALKELAKGEVDLIVNKPNSLIAIKTKIKPRRQPLVITTVAYAILA